MSRGPAACLLVLALLAGCGGEGDGDEAETLEFEQVRSITTAYFREGGEDRGRGAEGALDCEEPDWSAPGTERERRVQLDATQAERAEVLRCPPFESLTRALYLEFEDGDTARERLDALYGECLGRCAPYLVAGRTALALPSGAGSHTDTGTDYLDAVKAECGCGEVVIPEDE